MQLRLVPRLLIAQWMHFKAWLSLSEASCRKWSDVICPIPGSHNKELPFLVGALFGAAPPLEIWDLHFLWISMKVLGAGLLPPTFLVFSFFWSEQSLKQIKIQVESQPEISGWMLGLPCFSCGPSALSFLVSLLPLCALYSLYSLHWHQKPCITASQAFFFFFFFFVAVPAASPSSSCKVHPGIQVWPLSPCIENALCIG